MDTSPLGNITRAKGASSRGGSRISEGGVLISGTDSSGGDTEKFSRGCSQQFVSTNRNAYVSSGAGFKNFEDICNFSS